MSEEPVIDTDEYEEISSEEVDRIVESLEELTETVTSENIRTYLEDVTNTIYTLVYDEEEGDEEMELEDDIDIDMDIDAEFDDDIMDDAA